MANSDSVEFQLLDTDLTTQIAVLPFSDGRFILQLNEPGSGSCKIPLSSAAASLITTGQFVRVKYRGAHRGGFYVDNIRKVHASPGENTDGWLSISGRGLLASFSEGIVWSDGTNETTRTFTDQKKGAILQTLITEAFARGCVLEENFSATTDTLGNAWTDSETMDLVVGTNLLDVIRTMAKLGIDFAVTLEAGSVVLSAYKNPIGTDKSEIIYFRIGTNCEEVTQSQIGSEIRNAALVKYAGGYITATDATSVSTYRRRETLIHADEANASDTALSFANAEISNVKDPVNEIAVRVYDGIPPNVFVDYVIGDTVVLDNKGTEADYRIRGLSFVWNGDNPYASITVFMNSMVVENEIRVAREVNRLRRLFSTAHDANLLEASFWAAIADVENSGNIIHCMTRDGDNIYVGGAFINIGGVFAGNIARYNIPNAQWYAVGDQVFLNGFEIAFVFAITVSGSDIYAAGLSSDVGVVFKYSGGSWTTIATADAPCYAVKIIGSDVYIGGTFTQIGAVNTTGIARYDGASLNAMSGGLNGACYALAVSGTDLYIGGTFTLAGGVANTAYIAKWSSSTYSALGTGLNEACYALNFVGTDLYLGGNFTSAGGVSGTTKIAKWTGSAYAAIGTGANGICRAIADDGLNVYFGGEFTTAGGVTCNRIVGWNGSNFYSLSGGIDNNICYAIAVDSLTIYAGGDFTSVDGKAAIGIAAYFTNFNDISDFLHGSGTAYDLAADIHAATSKTTPVNADEMALVDSAASYGLKKLLWSNLKATLLAQLLSITTSRVVVTDGSGNITTDEDLVWDATSNILKIGGEPPISDGGGTTQIGQSASPSNFMFAFGGTLAGYLAFVRAGGTLASPTAVQSGDVIGRIRGRGHDGSTYSNTQVEIRLVATENWSGTNRGTKIEIHATPNGSTTLELVATIDSGGLDLPTGFTRQSRSLGNNVTLADGQCAILIDYLDLGTYELALDGDAELEIL